MKIKVGLICMDCGRKFGKYVAGCSTVHEGICDVCNKTKVVTEGRDWNVFELELKRSKL